MNKSYGVQVFRRMCLVNALPVPDEILLEKREDGDWTKAAVTAFCQHMVELSAQEPYKEKITKMIEALIYKTGSIVC